MGALVPFAGFVVLSLARILGGPDDAAPPMPEKLFETLEWRHIGPFRGGRSCTACGIPQDRMTYYFGACGGGVWKTVDAGKTWKNVSDGFFGGSIGAVAVSEADPNVVYVGTGEKTVRGNVSSGDGVYKSTDAGRTWKHVGLRETRHVGRIRIHPKDPDLVYVAAMGHISGPNEERGVFRSKDGGETWEKVLYVNEHAGAVDLILDPTNPRILYATTWRIIRTPYSLESGGEGSGIWKSTDSGDTWTELTRNEGLPQKGPVGICGIAVCPSRPDRVYAIVEHEDGGVFRSDDAGETWTRTNSDRALRQRAWYYSRIYADPKDEDVVYVLNVSFHKSKDGGRTFRERIRVPHGDNHDLWIDPDDPLRMIQTNDGGANVSFDGGRTWTAQDNQPTAQFYRVTTDDHFPYRIYGAQQDNSTVRIASRSDRGSISERDWEPTAGGESGHIAPDPLDPEIVYGGSYGGYLTRVNHRTGERRNVAVWPDNPMGAGAVDQRYRFQWNFPLLFSRHDRKTLYAAANVLFKTVDEGQTWIPISGDLTRDDESKQQSSGGPITQDNTSVEYYCTIFAVCESALKEGVIWCGSDDGLIHVTRDGGANWQDVTPANLPEWAQINCIEPHPFEEGGVYVAATRYKLDDFEPYLFRTLDYGRTWTRIDDGIDREHFTRAVRADPERPGLLYAGTERGVYVSFDDGARWQPLQLNLPVVPVTDLAVKEGDLIAATQGRSFWILDDLAHIRQLEPEMADARVALFAPEPVYRMGGGGRFGRAPARAGQNPPGGAVVRFLLAERPDDGASLEILEDDGDLVKRYALAWKETGEEEAGEEGPADGGEGEEDEGEADAGEEIEVEAGMNRFEWNLRYDGAKRVPGMVLWSGNLSGPRAIPGRYRARLTVFGETREVAFDVLKDPRSTSSVEDIAAQFSYLIRARDKLTATHETIVRLREIRRDVGDVLKNARGEDELKELGESIRKQADAIERTLYQTKNKSNQDPLNYPIRLNDKLSSVARGVDSGDFRPTAAQEAVYAELARAIDAELEKADTLEREEVPRFNALARELGVPHVKQRAEDDPDT